MTVQRQGVGDRAHAGGVSVVEKINIAGDWSAAEMEKAGWPISVVHVCLDFGANSSSGHRVGLPCRQVCNLRISPETKPSIGLWNGDGTIELTRDRGQRAH